MQVMEYIGKLESLNFISIVTTNGPLLVLFGVIFWLYFRTLSWNMRKPPGPIGLPILGYIPFLGKEPPKTLWELSKKYGDIMGLYLGTQYTVILSEYNIAKKVLSHPAALDRPTNLFTHLPNGGFGLRNGESWMEQRKFCRYATRDLVFDAGVWEDLIVDEISCFINKLRANKGKGVDFSQILTSSVMSNILSILIGRRLTEEQDGDKINLAIEYSDIVFSMTGASKTAFVIPGLRKFCEMFGIAGFDEARRIIQEFSYFVKEEIDRHKSSTNNMKGVNDFIDIYLEKLSNLENSGNRKHYFSDEMLEGNLNVLFLGGTDTIVSSLAWLLRLMGKNRDVQEKVYAELIEVIGYGGRARYRERQNIPYTFAVLMEAQRFSSIAPLNSNRKITQDIEVNGYTIPKGSQVATNLWGLHHDPTYWENPEEFQPERFLTDNGTKLITQPPSYFPFSVGRRNCPGEFIAWMEILLYFSEIVKNFEVCTLPGAEPEFEIVFGLVSHLKNQPLCFKERKRNI